VDGFGSQHRHSPDAPGHFVEWLCKVEKVNAYKITGSVLDIGNKESLAAARKILNKGTVLHRPAPHKDLPSKSIAFSKSLKKSVKKDPISAT